MRVRLKVREKVRDIDYGLSEKRGQEFKAHVIVRVKNYGRV